METDADEFKKFIEKLDPKRLLKKLLWGQIFLKIEAVLVKYVCNGINALIRSSKFHNEWKEADIVPIHKKDVFKRAFLKKITNL